LNLSGFCEEEFMTKLIESINNDFKEVVASFDTPESPSGKLHQTLSEEMDKAGCTFAAGPMPIFIKPYFIDNERMPYIRHTTEVWTRILDKVTNLYYESEEMRPLFYMNEIETQACAAPTGFQGRVRITRNDAFMTDGYLKYCEFNADSPGGPMYSDQQADIIEESPSYIKLAEKYDIGRDLIMPQVLKTLLDTFEGFSGRKTEKPKICISGGKGGTYPEFLAIVEWLKKKGFESAWCDSQEWTWDGKDLVSPEGFKPDIIYRRGWIGNWTHVWDNVQPVIRALEAGRVCMVNPLNSILASNKSLMAVLQRPDIFKMFNEEEQKVIRETLPWTWVVDEEKAVYHGEEVDLYDFMAKNREKLILKPIDQYGGKDVAIGPVLSDSEWDGWLQKTRESKFIVQEFIPVPREELPVVDEESNRIVFKPKNINVNFYCYGGVYTGGVVRSSDSAVINVHKGGGMTPIMFVRGKK
jgi:hypothetical protein